MWLGRAGTVKLGKEANKQALKKIKNKKAKKRNKQKKKKIFKKNPPKQTNTPPKNLGLM